jgi:hypothetical protein
MTAIDAVDGSSTRRESATDVVADKATHDSEEHSMDTASR